MVGKLTYDQVLNIAKDLREQVEVIERLIANRELPELNEIPETREVESTMEIL